MRKFIYLLFALLTFACNNEEDVFSEENNKYFHSMEEFNAFVHNAINESFPKQTRATEGSPISSTQIIECIKKNAIAKGIGFKIENEGTDNEFISFASEDPNIQYTTASCAHLLWTDNNLPNGGRIELIVWCTFKYQIHTLRIIEIGYISSEVKVPSHCPCLRSAEDTSLKHQINENRTGISYVWNGAITLHNPITDKGQRKVYNIVGIITMGSNK